MCLPHASNIRLGHIWPLGQCRWFMQAGRCRLQAARPKLNVCPDKHTYRSKNNKYSAHPSPRMCVCVCPGLKTSKWDLFFLFAACHACISEHSNIGVSISAGNGNRFIIKTDVTGHKHPNNHFSPSLCVCLCLFRWLHRDLLFSCWMRLVYD